MRVGMFYVCMRVCESTCMCLHVCACVCESGCVCVCNYFPPCMLPLFFSFAECFIFKKNIKSFAEACTSIVHFPKVLKLTFTSSFLS